MTTSCDTFGASSTGRTDSVRRVLGMVVRSPLTKGTSNNKQSGKVGKTGEDGRERRDIGIDPAYLTWKAVAVYSSCSKR
jgi:hypothetical protein